MDHFDDIKKKYTEAMGAFEGKTRKTVNDQGHAFTRKYLIDAIYEVKDICDKLFQIHATVQNESEQITKVCDKIVDQCLIKINEQVTESRNGIGFNFENLSGSSGISFADVLRSSEGEKFASSIAQSTLTHQAKEESERKLKENNVVIFHMDETNEDQALQSQNDKKFVDELCEVPLELKDMAVKEVFRLGKTPVENKTRPVKVVFNNSFDKRKFMASLTKLRDADQRFKSISVSHDMTVREREYLKTLLNEAEEKNNLETQKNYVWRVRGDPANMKLVRLKKRQQD